jgi:hypothetical protein
MIFIALSAETRVTGGRPKCNRDELQTDQIPVGPYACQMCIIKLNQSHIPAVAQRPSAFSGLPAGAPADHQFTIYDKPWTKF